MHMRAARRRTRRFSRVTAAWYSSNAARYDRVVTRGILRLATGGGGRDAIAAWARSIPSDMVPVLDVPTGTGEYLPVLPRPAVDADLAAGMLREAAARGTGALLVRADVFALPFPDASFGSVFTSLGLQLMPRPSEAVAEMARVLRPGGRLVGAVPVGLFSRFLSAASLRRALEVPGVDVLRLEHRGWLVVFTAEKSTRAGDGSGA